MNSAKKVVIFITMHIFSKGILDKIRRLHKVHTLCAFIFFIFGHHVETSGPSPLISAPQLCMNKLKDVTNLSDTTLLPIVVQVYEFHRNRKS